MTIEKIAYIPSKRPTMSEICEVVENWTSKSDTEIEDELHVSINKEELENLLNRGYITVDQHDELIHHEVETAIFFH